MQFWGYIVFKGSGLIIEWIKVGLDYVSDYYGWFSYWFGVWSIYNSVIYVCGVLCKIIDYFVIVKIFFVVVGILVVGGNSQVFFYVSLECEFGVVFSVFLFISVVNVVMGFVVN